MSERLEDLFDLYVDRLIAGDGGWPCASSGEQELLELPRAVMETGALVAHQLRAIEPDPQFRATAHIRMRNQFFARLAKGESRPNPLALWWQQRWASAMATVMVVCLAGLGVLAASFNALPSGFFYPVKVTTEQVRLSLATSEYERAQLRLDYAERRLAEMSSMADQGDAETAVVLAGEATRLIFQTAASAAFGLSDYQESQLSLPPSGIGVDEAPVLLLTADRSESLVALEAALAVAPDELKPGIQRLMNELTREFDTTIARLESSTTR